MNNNIFAIVKANVTLPEVARHYGLRMTRGNMVCCPFHNDRHPSMKLNEDFYYCFGCGATGDVIDFVAKLTGLTSYEAAMKLAADFGLDTDPDLPPAAAGKKVKRELVDTFREQELYCMRVLMDYLHILEDWKKRYAPKNPSEEIHDHFVEACQMLDYVEHLVDILALAEFEVREKAVDMLHKDGMIERLAGYVKCIREEEKHHEPERD